MNRLIIHIERLLLMHDCVIIPDFGGFVLQEIASYHNTNTNMFFPPRKEVVFNQSLIYNDGLLVESYMRMYDMDFGKAQQFVKNDVAQLKEVLENEGELQFGMTGVFVSDNGRVLFMAVKNVDTLYSTSCYGLPVFHFLPLQNCKQLLISVPEAIKAAVVQPGETGREEPENEDILYKISVTRTFIRAVAAAAAAILLFLFIATPVKDVNRELYRASFVPQEIMPKKSADDVINEAFAKIKEGQIENNEDLALAENTVTTETEPIVATSVETKAAEAGITETKVATNMQSNNYYVIIGSFNTKIQANKYIKMLKDQEAKTAGILVRDGHVRVYAQGFSTEKSANLYMNKLRQTTKHKQAWTYKIENE